MVQRFTDMGLTVCAAFELEFYLIDQENVNGRPQPPRSPISGKRPQAVQVYSIDDLDEYADCLRDILDGAHIQGIPADAIVKESAPAQFEVNLNHVADPLKACDYAVLLKRLIKNTAYDHEMDTTFMAKPYPGQAGNGLHVHISLLDRDGNNIFAAEDPLASDALRHAIGGVLEILPASMAFLCPNVNSYRRFGSQFYVPNAPSWGLDNRTVALRVPTGPPDALRIEQRVAGADANPYLLMAALLAGVHHGLTRRIEPGAPIEGNSYEQLEQSLPNNLRDALRTLDDSEILARYISPEYVDLFVACKDHELEEFEARSPTWSTTGTCTRSEPAAVRGAGPAAAGRSPAPGRARRPFDPAAILCQLGEPFPRRTRSPMSRIVTVAATQMACSWDRAANLARAEQLVRQAAAGGAQIILIQELFDAIFCRSPTPTTCSWPPPWPTTRPSPAARRWPANWRWCCR